MLSTFLTKYGYSSLENFSFDLIIQAHILKLKMVRKLSHGEIWSLLPSFLLLFSHLPSSLPLSIPPSMPLFLPYVSTSNTLSPLVWGIPLHSREWFPILQAQMKKYFSHPHPLRGQRHVTGSAITSLCRLQVRLRGEQGKYLSLHSSSYLRSQTSCCGGSSWNILGPGSDKWQGHQGKCTHCVKQISL